MADINEILVTREAPVFKAKAVMPDNTFQDLDLESYRGRYVVLFFYPLDFTFVCPTEILAFNRKLDEFRRRNTDIIGISIDSEFSHLAWKNTLPEKGGIGDIQYPLISDITKKISRDYGVLLRDSIALRGLFLIDRDGIIRHMVINDLPLGRSIDKVLRMVDALQNFEKNGEVCPADWHEGEEAMKPTNDGVAEYLNKHTA